MIVVGEFYDPTRRHPMKLACAIDADRGVELLRDTVSGAFCVVVTNGQVTKRMALSREAAEAVMALLHSALVDGWPQAGDF